MIAMMLFIEIFKMHGSLVAMPCLRYLMSIMQAPFSPFGHHQPANAFEDYEDDSSEEGNDEIVSTIEVLKSLSCDDVSDPAFSALPKPIQEDMIEQDNFFSIPQQNHVLCVKVASTASFCCACHSTHDFSQDSLCKQNPVFPAYVGHCCFLCTQDFKHGKLLTMAPCGHAFHPACFTLYFSKSDQTCPICKVLIKNRSICRVVRYCFSEAAV